MNYTVDHSNKFATFLVIIISGFTTAYYRTQWTLPREQHASYSSFKFTLWQALMALLVNYK